MQGVYGPGCALLVCKSSIKGAGLGVFSLVELKDGQLITDVPGERMTSEQVGPCMMPVHIALWCLADLMDC